jgi:hypothetical protein
MLQARNGKGAEMKSPHLIALALAGLVAAAPGAVSAHTGDPHEDVPMPDAHMETMMVEGTRSADLTIIHVQHGCHVWTDMQASQTPSAEVTLQRTAMVRVSDALHADGWVMALGQAATLEIANMDLDTHQLVQLAGTAVGRPEPMAMNGKAALRFTRPGAYRFQTRVVEKPEVSTEDMPRMADDHMPGMTGNGTDGEDHLLRLTVSVS